MSSELFESHELEYRALQDDIQTKVDTVLPNLTGGIHFPPRFIEQDAEARKTVKRDIERAIEDANVLILEMEGEARSAPAPYRSRMVSKLRGYKSDLEVINRKLVTSYTGDRDALFGYPLDDDNELNSFSSAQRSRLQQGTESLNRTTESIARSHQIAAETDVIGTDIIDDLGTQRESLIRTRDRLQETDSNLTRSRKILKTMGITVMTNKLILAIIIFVLLAILGGVVYYRFFRK